MEDFMLKKLFGVVEGFYGFPWSMADRKEIITFLGKKSLNTYIYAPKDDPLHRFKWEKSYDKDFIEEFRVLINHSINNNISISYAISPGQSIKYSSEEDANTLMKKFSLFYDLGVRIFSLFLDDIPEKLANADDSKKFKNLFKAQSYFINEINFKLKKIDKSNSLIICPTIYRGDPFNDQSKIFKEELNKDIYIFWTGPEVCSKNIPVSDALNFTDGFGVEPLYWDNFPVNDASMVSELHIGEYKGRDPELLNCSNGILLNPMNQARSSKIAISQLSDYIKDPINYNPKVSHKRAIEEIAPKCSKSFYAFSKFCTESPLDSKKPIIYEKIMNPVIKKLESGNIISGLKLLNKNIVEIDEMTTDITKNCDERLLKEIKNWLDELKNWNETLKITICLINSYTNSYSNGEMLIKKKSEIEKNIELLESKLIELIKQKTNIGGNIFREFVYKNLLKARGYLTLYV